tara:strand:- start:84 stop:779 length:696 start_codon:yes stop_codon:yes gene_type:complete
MNNPFGNEPTTYSQLAEALNISKDSYHKKTLQKNMDSHSQIKDAHFFSSRIKYFINTKKNIKILDCGCGLGFIARGLKKYKNFEVFLSEPSESIKKIIENVYPEDNFLPFSIEDLPKKFHNFFDVIYLREVYPFTRTSDIDLQDRLIKAISRHLKEDGVLIFEQIKNEKDLFCNLKELNLDYKIFYLMPTKWLNFEWFYKIYFKVHFLSIFIRLIYKVFNKKINHFIVIKK